MKSTERSPKLPKQQPKPNDQSPKLDLVAYKPVEKQQPTSQPDITPSDDLPSVEQPAQAEVIPLVRSKTNAAEKPQHLEKSKAKRTSADKRKSKLPQQPKQHGQLTKSDEEEELPPEPCQHNAISGLQLGGRACDIRVLPLQFGDNQRVHRRSCNGRVQRTTFGDFHKGKMP